MWLLPEYDTSLLLVPLGVTSAVELVLTLTEREMELVDESDWVSVGLTVNEELPDKETSSV